MSVLDPVQKKPLPEGGRSGKGLYTQRRVVIN
jgi:hypothetical protein